MGQRAAVHILELTTDGHAVRDAARADAALHSEIAEEMRSGLAFHRRIRGKNELAHLAFVENALELAHAELIWPDAIERREVTHQHEVVAAETSGLLHRHHV